MENNEHKLPSNGTGNDGQAGYTKQARHTRQTGYTRQAGHTGHTEHTGQAASIRYPDARSDPDRRSPAPSEALKAAEYPLRPTVKQMNVRSLWKRLFTHRTLPVLALLFLLAIRLPHIGDSPFGYDSWRQSDTEAMARNFVEHRFNVLYPQLNYQGPMPNYAQLELQITTFLIAILYKLFGYSYIAARFVPVAFFIGSAWFVYRIAARRYSAAAALFALLMYGLLPLNLLYSRAIMPESAALFFYTGAFYWFSEWIAKEKRSLLLAAALFTSLAICEKIPTVFVGVPMLVMVIAKYRGGVFKRLELWGFALLSLLPPYVYYAWLGTLAESTFVSGIASKHIVPRFATAAWSAEARQFFATEMPKAFTWTGLVVAAAGLILLLVRRRDFPLLVWTLAIAAELATIVAVIRFPYYMIFAGPLIALLSAGVLELWTKLGGEPNLRRRGSNGRGFSNRSRLAAGLCAVAVLAVISAESYRQVVPVIGIQNEELIRQAEVVERLTVPDDLIVTGTDDPSLLNASRRTGWRVTNSIPGDPVAELDYFVREGAAYFVPLKGYIDGDPDGLLRRTLEERYPKLEAGSEYYIYKLR
ncbi:glycosyltransferase family 39 protein [Paenibacillus sp. GYB004]|uniref:ArnT family glycosyltransferase n=1 Tax=Paenibacillus sp. GYB004 TaxID=2994393 RepID=UPI002F962176